MSTPADIRSEIISQYPVGTSIQGGAETKTLLSVATLPMADSQTDKWEEMLERCSHRAGAKNTNPLSEGASEIVKTFEERLSRLHWPTYEAFQSWVSVSLIPASLQYPNYSQIAEAMKQLQTDFPELHREGVGEDWPRYLDSVANLWRALDTHVEAHAVITYTKLTLERYVLALYGRELKPDDQSELESQRQEVEVWEVSDDNPCLRALIYITSCITAQALRSVVS